MELFWILIGILAVIVIGTFTVAGVTIWICKATDPCRHIYERVDICNDEKMLFVCRKCGKIKKLRK